MQASALVYGDNEYFTWQYEYEYFMIFFYNKEVLNTLFFKINFM